MELPEYFQPLFWDVQFKTIDPTIHKRLILTRTINYGQLVHWKWLSKFYGNDLKDELQTIPRSEFRPPALNLAKLIYNLDDFQYASRSDYIKSQKVN